MLPTTTVGSFPKPDYLQKARTQFSAGKLTEADLRALELQATREVVRQQEEVGLDILVHGEMERGDMTTYFAEKLVGMGISDLVRSYGNRYYRKPIVEGALQRPAPMTVESVQLYAVIDIQARQRHAHRSVHHVRLVVQHLLRDEARSRAGVRKIVA